MYFFRRSWLGKLVRSMVILTLFGSFFVSGGATVFADVGKVVEGDLQVFNGANRYITANKISQASYNRANTAILVNSENFPDALAAGPLAFAYGAPILLTPTEELNRDTRVELSRLGVKEVFIIGGIYAIGKSVEDELRSLGYSVERIYGATRYQTPIEVSKKLYAKSGNKKKAMITVSDHYADALSIGSYASKEGIPILLTDRNSMNQETIDYLLESGINYVTIVGGELAVDNLVVKQLESANIFVSRISGADRVETSTKIAENMFQDPKNAIIANGWTFVDALAATPYAAKLNAPILLVDRNMVQTKVIHLLKFNEYNKVDIAGGDFVISGAVRDKLQEAINDMLFTIRVLNNNGTYSNQTVKGRIWNDYAKEAFDRQNQHRVTNGTHPLVWVEDLNQTSILRSSELSILFSHTRPDGTMCYTAGTHTFHGENVAAGYTTPENVFEGFKKSAGHNENMLRSRFTKGAFGCVVIGKRFYWTSLFAQ